MKAAPRLFVIVGGPASGKDEVLQSVANMGGRHADIVPKHTDRLRRDNDGSELIFKDEVGYALHKCEIKYRHNENLYGIDIGGVWIGLQNGVSQVLVASSEDALHRLRAEFGELLVLCYVHSNFAEESFVQRQTSGLDDGYVIARAKNFNAAFQLYVANILLFDHVLIYSDAAEDLYDQIFRLFRAYETSPSIGRLKSI